MVKKTRDTDNPFDGLDADPAHEKMRQFLKGEKGDKGDRGEQGPQGKAGLNGADGLNGRDGKNGLNGRDGRDGKDGISIVGKDGKDGIDGATPVSAHLNGDALVFVLSDGREISAGDLPKHVPQEVMVQGGGAFAAYIAERVSISPGTFTATNVGDALIELYGMIGGAGVSSLNTLTGAVTLSAGSNITLTPVGNDIEISASGGGSSAFNDITSGTNTTAAMVVGTGGSLATSGSGTIAATSAATVSTANEAADTTCFPLFVTSSGTQTLQPMNNTSLTFNANTGALGASNLSGTNTGDQTISLTGDVTGSGTGSFAATIANDAVTYAKMQNVSAASKLLGRGDSGAGDVQEITLGSGLTMTGTTLSASGGGGGISGPVSSTVGEIPVFDVTTGDSVGNSNVIMTDNMTTDITASPTAMGYGFSIADQALVNYLSVTATTAGIYANTFASFVEVAAASASIAATDINLTGNVNCSNGATGSFTAQTGEVVTVTNGIITSIV
jgi:hypothetical protein